MGEIAERKFFTEWLKSKNIRDILIRSIALHDRDDINPSTYFYLSDCQCVGVKMPDHYIEDDSPCRMSYIIEYSPADIYIGEMNSFEDIEKIKGMAKKRGFSLFNLSTGRIFPEDQ